MKKISAALCLFSSTVCFASDHLVLNRSNISRVDAHTAAQMVWSSSDQGGSIEVGSCSLNGFVGGTSYHLAFDVASYRVVGSGYETMEEAYVVARQFLQAVRSGKCER